MHRFLKTRFVDRWLRTSLLLLSGLLWTSVTASAEPEIRIARDQGAF